MRISAMWPRNKQHHRKMGGSGFTLVEILVVIVIIGIMVSVAAVALYDPKKSQLTDEAERLKILLRYVHDQSELSQKIYGIKFNEQGYQFFSFVEKTKQWASTPDNALKFHTYKIPLTATIEMASVTDTTVPINKEITAADTTDSSNDTPIPNIAFWGNGEYSTFQLTLSIKEERSTEIKILGDGFNPPSILLHDKKI